MHLVEQRSLPAARGAELELDVLEVQPVKLGSERRGEGIRDILLRQLGALPRHGVAACVFDTKLVRPKPLLAFDFAQYDRLQVAQLGATAKGCDLTLECYAVLGVSGSLDGVRALAGCRARLLPVPAFCSMLPDNIGPEAARIDVPVFIGLGSRDMAGPPHQVPAAFSGSGDLTLQVLPATGHSHFLFPSRAGLFRRLAHWAAYAAARETSLQHGVEPTS